MEIITENTKLPKELAEMILVENYKLFKQGVPVEEAIRKGTRIAVEFWREKNANKSGG